MKIYPVTPDKRLLISGEIDDWTLVNTFGVDAVIDLDGTIDSEVPEVPNQTLYIYFPFIDEYLPDESKLFALGRLTASLVAAGRVVLIHCYMGLNRSNLVAATALTFLGMEGQQAVAHLRALQPAALYNPTYAEFVARLPASPVSGSDG
jgi:protein-tyrosine phosphatase